MADRLRATILGKDAAVAGRLLTTGGLPAGLAWSPDHRWLAAACPGGVHLWDSDFSRPRRVLWPGVPTHAVAFSPDGRTLYAGCERGEVRTWESPDGGSGTLPVGGDADAASGFAWCSGGRRLAVRFDHRGQGPAPTVAVWDVSEGRVAWRLPATEGRVLAIAPADGRLITASSSGPVRLWDAESGDGRGEIAAGLSAVIALDSAGDALALAGYLRGGGPNRNGVHLWRLSTRTRLTEGSLDTSLIRAVNFAPGGRLLATGGLSQAALWDVAGRRELRKAGEPGKTHTWAQAFSPGGGLLAIATAPSAGRVVDVRGDLAVAGGGS
jgi:WD40 repeat protein